MTGEPKGQYHPKVSGDPLRYSGMFLPDVDLEMKFIEMTMEQWLTWDILQDELEDDAVLDIMEVVQQESEELENGEIDTSLVPASSTSQK